jgi:hypothetical protein
MQVCKDFLRKLLPSVLFYFSSYLLLLLHDRHIFLPDSCASRKSKPVLLEQCHLLLESVLKNFIALRRHSRPRLAHKLRHMANQAQMLSSSTDALDGAISTAACAQQINHAQVHFWPIPSRVWHGHVLAWLAAFQAALSCGAFSSTQAVCEQPSTRERAATRRAPDNATGA